MPETIQAIILTQSKVIFYFFKAFRKIISFIFFIGFPICANCIWSKNEIFFYSDVKNSGKSLSNISGMILVFTGLFLAFT